MLDPPAHADSRYRIPDTRSTYPFLDIEMGEITISSHPASSIQHQNVFARYELNTTVIELRGMRTAASSGLMWPVMAKLTATTL